MAISLPSIISSGMVIEKRARIWGLCDDSTSVKVEFLGKVYSAPVNGGKWEVFVASSDFGGPFEMLISDIRLTDVYVGRVFMMCGQSNMEMSVSRVRIKYDEDFKNLVDNPRIRGFRVGLGHEFKSPRTDCEGSWQAKNPATVNDFFALSHYVSEKLIDTLDCPIGLIECAVGGSRIESWLSEESVKYTGYSNELLRLCKYEGFTDGILRYDEERTNKWHDDINARDIGLKEGYYSYEYDHVGWAERELTAPWADDIGMFHGVMWFRKTFNASADMAGLPGRLFLGRISDSDIAYLNGEQIGRIEYKHPPRVYPVREGLVREGRNTIAVRVVSSAEYGGFTSDKEYMLETAAGNINVDGKWAYKAGCKAETLPTHTRFYNYPCALYNAMLAPVLPFPVSAFLWYQGESNDQSPYLYSMLLSRLIRDIRANYGENLPFAAVQLPNFDAGEHNESWRIIREHQETVLNHNNTALIITTDIGEDNDVHPLNKRDVGARLAEGVLCLISGNSPVSDKVKVNP